MVEENCVVKTIYSLVICALDKWDLKWKYGNAVAFMQQYYFSQSVYG